MWANAVLIYLGPYPGISCTIIFQICSQRKVSCHVGGHTIRNRLFRVIFVNPTPIFVKLSKIITCMLVSARWTSFWSGQVWVGFYPSLQAIEMVFVFASRFEGMIGFF